MHKQRYITVPLIEHSCPPLQWCVVWNSRLNETNSRERLALLKPVSCYDELCNGHRRPSSRIAAARQELSGLIIRLITRKTARGLWLAVFDRFPPVVARGNPDTGETPANLNPYPNNSLRLQFKKTPGLPQHGERKNGSIIGSNVGGDISICRRHDLSDLGWALTIGASGSRK